MKVAALAALSVLIALPAEAGERHRQNNASPICDNDGRCAALTVTAPTSSKASSFRGRHTGTSERKPHHVVDANGNSMLVTVQTAYGFNITVHPSYASKFLKFFALLKERGYRVPANITRCWAPRGTHVAGSNHYIGAACDIQTGWNRGPAFVYHMDDIVKQAGLYSGCTFRDCGHVEAVRGLHNRAPNLYAAMEKFKSEQSTANYQP
jgi:hypothetical protein